jgi:hypothetical protein
MNKPMLVVRCLFEGLLGLFLLLGAVAQLPKFLFMLRNEFNVAYLLGSVTGLLILAILGFLLCRDSLRVFRRIRPTPVA